MIPLLESCRGIARSIESDITRDISDEYGMHKILPSAHWKETWQQSQTWFWYFLFAWQMIIIASGFYTGILINEHLSNVQNCLSSSDCAEVVEYSEQLRFIASHSRYPMSILSGFVVLFGFSVFMQIGWVAAASAHTHPQRSGVFHFFNGIAQLPRSFILGLLPMRLVAFAMWFGYKSLGNIEVRWQMMIKGRFCQFILTSIIAARVPYSRFSERCEQAAAKHQLELLDAMGTYNMLWLVAILSCLVLGIPAYFEWTHLNVLGYFWNNSPEI